MTEAAPEYLNLARAAQRGLRVLVVDDHPVNRQVLTLTLARIPAKAECAENGAEAVEVFGREPFDIVLMDLRMPVMDGFEAMRRMRALEESRGAPPTPMIVCSAHTTPMDIARAGEAGANLHLGKPLHIPTLLEAMDQVLAPPDETAAG